MVGSRGALRASVGSPLWGCRGWVLPPAAAGAWLPGEMPHPWGGRISQPHSSPSSLPTSPLTLSHLSSPSAPGRLLVPHCFAPSCLPVSSPPCPLGPRPGFSGKSPGSGRAGPAASQEALSGRPAQPQEAESLCDLSRDSPHTLQQPVPSGRQHPSPWLTSAFQGLWRNEVSVPERCG